MHIYEKENTSIILKAKSDSLALIKTFAMSEHFVW